MKLFGVVGHPISHSLSPKIHKFLAQDFGVEKFDYHLINLPPNQLAQFLKTDLLAYQGLNVTLPFKQEAISHINLFDSKHNQSINTLINKQGKWWGSSTDGYGFIQSVQKHNQFELKDKSILIIGAGGSCVSIIPELIDCQVKNICIANRSIEKAQKLAQIHQSFDIQAKSLNELSHLPSFDMIVNSTSIAYTSGSFHLTHNLFHSNTFVYELSYGKKTLFTQYAQEKNLVFSDGLTMLVEQAVQSFNLWFDTQTPNKTVDNLIHYLTKI